MNLWLLPVVSAFRAEDILYETILDLFKVFVVLNRHSNNRFSWKTRKGQNVTNLIIRYFLNE